MIFCFIDKSRNPVNPMNRINRINEINQTNQTNQTNQSFVQNSTCIFANSLRIWRKQRVICCQGDREFATEHPCSNADSAKRWKGRFLSVCEIFDLREWCPFPTYEMFYPTSANSRFILMRLYPIHINLNSALNFSRPLIRKCRYLKLCFK